MPWGDRQPNPHLTEWAATAKERGIVAPAEDPPKLRWRAEFTRG